VPAKPNPRQREVRSVETPAVKDASRSVHREFDNGLISMELQESAAVDDPQKTGSTEVLEGAFAPAAKQRHGLPAQPGGALGPVFG
jgi:hypothetical protein